MIGLRILRTRSHFEVRSPSSMLAGVASTNDFLMSAPPENAFSSPVRTRQRISGSSSSCSSAATSSSMSSSDSALRTSGRSSCTVAMGASRMTLIVLTGSTPPFVLVSMPVPLSGGPKGPSPVLTGPMVPRGLPIMEMPRLERAINNARWVGAIAVVAIAPFFRVVGTGYVIALALSLVFSAIVIPRLRQAYVAQVVDTGVGILAMFLFAPDPEWPQSIIGVFLVMGGAFRFGRVGSLLAAATATSVFLALSLYRQAAFGYALLPQRLAFDPAIFLITALFMAGLIWQLQAVPRRTD